MFGTDLGAEYRAAAGLGMDAADAYVAGLSGALCDEETRGHLATLWMESGLDRIQ